MTEKYLVIADRYGTGTYQFPIGVFNDRTEAIKAAESHRDFRGNKYNHKLYYIKENVEYDAEECRYEWITGNKQLENSDNDANR